MEFDKDYNNAWISTRNGLYSYNFFNKELFDWTKKYEELIESKLPSSTPIIINKDKIWIVTNGLISIDKYTNKWTMFRDELDNNENAGSILIGAFISSPNYLWLHVRRG